MNTIHIPKTMKEMENHLNGVERLLTAKKWERAAIVSVRPDQREPSSCYI